MQWKKSLLSLQIFRNLLLHGPLNVIAEGIDGFASIRILKSYAETLRGQNSKLIRDVAMEIYSLLVDLPVLFARRRQCMNSRRMVKDPKPSPLRKETRMVSGISKFRNIHIALRPAGAPVAPAPVQVDDLLLRGTTPAATSSSAGSRNYSDDLLSMGVAAAPSPQVTMSGVVPPPPGNYSSDLLSLSFGAAPQPQLPATSNAESGAMLDPFSMYEMSQAAAATTTPPSQPEPQQSAPKPSFASSVTSVVSSPPGQPFQPMPNAPTGAPNTQVLPQPSQQSHFNPMTNGVMSYQPIPNTQQQFQPQRGMNPYMMTNQPMQAPQPSLVNQAFPTTNYGGRPVSFQNAMHGPPMNNPMTIPNAQGYQQPQQPWMQGPLVQNNGLQPPPPQNSASIQAPAAGYPMMQMTSQFQQGTYPPQNANTHGQIR